MSIQPYGHIDVDIYLDREFMIKNILIIPCFLHTFSSLSCAYLDLVSKVDPESSPMILIPEVCTQVFLSVFLLLSICCLAFLSPWPSLAARVPLDFLRPQMDKPPPGILGICGCQML
jgi:hypothetical protein